MSIGDLAVDEGAMASSTSLDDALLGVDSTEELIDYEHFVSTFG